MFIVNPFKPSLLMSLFSTHPPVEERVKIGKNIIAVRISPKENNGASGGFLPLPA